MSLRKLRQDLINATFIGAAAAGAFLLVTWNRLNPSEGNEKRWLKAAEEEYVPIADESPKTLEAVA